MNLQRLNLLIGADKVSELKSKKIILFGVGGVGGWLAEMLARCGICNLTIVDFDLVDETNINRQLIATSKTIGLSKVDLIEKRLQDINPTINIIKFGLKVTPDNLETFDLKSYDFVIDCIDDIKAKKALILFCSLHKINLVCAMGAGNRYCVPHYEIKNIYDSTYDGLAKVIRKFCRDNKIKKLMVACTDSQPKKFDNTVGSVVYHPVACASVLCAYVVNKLIGENEK